MIYFDNAATTRPLDEAIEKSLSLMRDGYGNPSALYTFAAAADSELKAARTAIASALGAKPDEIYFTSGGTEGNNIAILGTAEAKKRQGKRIITSSVEHASVDNPIKILASRGYDCVTVPSPMGEIDYAELERELNADTILVSVMLVNNELGTINDIARIRTLMKRKAPNATLHCDAVQGFLKVKFNIKTVPADIITLSSHKIHAPKGSGAIYIKKGTKISPIMFGGGQESDMRSGTQNVPAIAAFGVAAKLGYERLDERIAHAKQLKDLFIAKISEHPELFTINSPENSSPFIVNISTPVMSETVLHYLEGFDIYISVGSACSSKHKSRSILSRAGFSDKRYKTGIRISFGDFNSEEEILTLTSRLTDAAKELIWAK